MLLHDGYVVGRHWKHINGRCTVPGQEEIWDLAKQLWKQKTGTDLVITKGIIMSCGIQPPDIHKNATKRAMERFRRILISESAHLIWKIRNDRVINDKPNYTPREIEQRWSHAVNRRIRLDCILSDKKKFKKKAIQVSLVLKTWQGTLLKESSLPEDVTRPEPMRWSPTQYLLEKLGSQCIKALPRVVSSTRGAFNTKHIYNSHHAHGVTDPDSSTG